MNLTTIIEKKKEEFRKSFPYCWIEWKKPGNFSPIQSKNKMLEVERFLEKAIRESVEEALREVRPKFSYEYDGRSCSLKVTSIVVL